MKTLKDDLVKATGLTLRLAKPGLHYDIFAKHRFDVGYNKELKIKLKPERHSPVYLQSPLTPIHLRNEYIV